MSSYITWRTFDKCQRLCDFYQIIPYYSEQYNNLFPCLTEDHLVYIAYTLWLYIIWQRGLFATLISWFSWKKKHPKNQETKVRWPPVSVNTLLWWLPPWAETDGLYEFSPGGNKVQLSAPSTLQIMFIVELSVIKPITAEQIKASMRELISSRLSPSLNHGTDLMPWLSSASRIEMGPSRLRYFYEIKQWISDLIHFICGELY